MSLSDALGVHGALVQIDHGGARYALLPVTQRAKDEVKQGLRRLALADAHAVQGAVPPDQYAAMIDSISRMTAARQFDYGGPVYLETMRSPAGLAWLLSVLLRRYDPAGNPVLRCDEEEVYELLQSRPAEMKLLAREVVRSSLPRAVVAEMDRLEAEEGKPHPAEADPTSPG